MWHMAGRGDTATLARAVKRGEYVVDAAAVAEAMLASGVLVSAKPAHWLTFWALHDEARSRFDRS
jgi:hypothetical protein